VRIGDMDRIARMLSLTCCTATDLVIGRATVLAIVRSSQPGSRSGSPAAEQGVADDRHPSIGSPRLCRLPRMRLARPNAQAACLDRPRIEHRARWNLPREHPMTRPVIQRADPSLPNSLALVAVVGHPAENRRRSHRKLQQQRRNLKMAGSVHAYMPGNALKFYEWLGTADSGTIPVGPPVWICDKPEADVTMFAATGLAKAAPSHQEPYPLACNAR
jgi:hypothetical protein